MAHSPGVSLFVDPHSEPGGAARQAFWLRPPQEVAADLIGWVLLVDGVGGRIVETEAYGPNDPASHSFNGRTRRNAAMFGPGGHAYIYRSYGLHWCVNAVTGSEGEGAAVLIRALEPTHGVEIMAARRGGMDARALCSGPGRLTQALAVSDAHNGAPLHSKPFALIPGRRQGLLSGPRIGISKGVETPWRFGEAGSGFLSRRFG
jgi:DNA-3-methyladenine glycosylase